MNNPTTSEEITFEQQLAINEFVEAYKNNPSNSNKALHALYTYINGLLEVQAAEFDAWKDQEVAKARKQAANDIFNLAHEYASDDTTMVGSEELRSYHYFNAIHKIGELDGR